MLLEGLLVRNVWPMPSLSSSARNGRVVSNSDVAGVNGAVHVQRDVADAFEFCHCKIRRKPAFASATFWFFRRHCQNPKCPPKTSRSENVLWWRKKLFVVRVLTQQTPPEDDLEPELLKITMSQSIPAAKSGYNRFLLLVAGLGGLLYGVDVGIIAGALPYLRSHFRDLNAGQLSFIVAAVLLGSVISTLFAGVLADWLGRKKMMTVERHSVRRQHSDDCAGARLLAAGFRPVVARHQRRVDRRGRAALSGRMSAARPIAAKARAFFNGC